MAALSIADGAGTQKAAAAAAPLHAAAAAAQADASSSQAAAAAPRDVAEAVAARKRVKPKQAAAGGLPELERNLHLPASGEADARPKRSCGDPASRQGGRKWL